MIVTDSVIRLPMAVADSPLAPPLPDQPVLNQVAEQSDTPFPRAIYDLLPPTGNSPRSVRAASDSANETLSIKVYRLTNKWVPFSRPTNRITVSKRASIRSLIDSVHTVEPIGFLSKHYWKRMILRVLSSFAPQA